jgi:PIN domain nuclease of toxin-antitoxin system
VIVLDTHIFLWITEENTKRIPAAIRSALEIESVLGVSAISMWEIAMLENKGRIVLSIPILSWLQKALAVPKMRLLPITPEIAALSATLPIHGDPADRMIAATAIVQDCRLATVDDLLLKIPGLKTVV